MEWPTENTTQAQDRTQDECGPIKHTPRLYTCSSGFTRVHLSDDDIHPHDAGQTEEFWDKLSQLLCSCRTLLALFLPLCVAGWWPVSYSIVLFLLVLWSMTC